MRINVGDELVLVRGRRHGHSDSTLARENVVVLDEKRVTLFHDHMGSITESRVYVEHEDGGCEWVPPHWLVRAEG